MTLVAQCDRLKLREAQEYMMDYARVRIVSSTFSAVFIYIVVTASGQESPHYS